MMKMNCLWLVSLTALLWTDFSEQLERMAECNPLLIEEEQVARMTNEEQETYVKTLSSGALCSSRLSSSLQARSILDQYDQNLTSIAYITSSSEYEIHLFLNDTSKKQMTVSELDEHRRSSDLWPLI